MPPVIFRQITFQRFQLGSSEIELFTDKRSSSGHSLAKRTEQAVIAWLVRDAAARELLCEVLRRSPDAFMRNEIQEPFYGSREGDIDLLICNSGAPQQAVVIECKRVKVQVVDDGNDQVNKLEDVGEGVKQAKKLYERFGFYQTYLAVISTVDAANRKTVNIPNRGVTSNSVPNWDTSTTTFKRLIEFPRREELPHDIGVIFIELVQPSGERFEEQGTFRICIHHPATPLMQRDSETRKVETLMNGPL